VDKIGSYQEVLPRLYPDHEICEIKKSSEVLKKLTGITAYANNLLVH
jgi:hypothetical protein